MRIQDVRRRIGKVAAYGVAAIALALLAAPGALAQASPRWAATWAASPSLPMPPMPSLGLPKPPTLEGTLRYRLRVSAGGPRLRIALSGGIGVNELAVGAATIGVARGDRLDVRTMKQLRFGGASNVLVQSGAQILSDPVDLVVADGAVVVVTLHLAQPVQGVQADPQHVVEMRAGADMTAQANLGGAKIANVRPLVTGIHVENPNIDRVIVAFGDSITDGYGASDPLMRGWPDFFAARLRANGLSDVAIVNAGIGGNRLLETMVGESALIRFDRDALAIPGVTDIILLEGINDLGLSGLRNPATGELLRTLTADDIIWAYRQLIDRAHARGVRIIGATVTPALGTAFPGYATPEKETLRQQVIQWIRTSGAFDAVIDFDAAVRDPANPAHLLAAYDVGDKLHPSDAGYRAMAEAIDLGLFRR